MLRRSDCDLDSSDSVTGGIAFPQHLERGVEKVRETDMLKSRFHRGHDGRAASAHWAI